MRRRHGLFDSATRAALYSLQALGYAQEDAREMVEMFIVRDKKGLRELAGLWNPDIPVEDNQPYLLKAKEMSEQLAADMLARQRQADSNKG